MRSQMDKDRHIHPERDANFSRGPSHLMILMISLAFIMVLAMDSSSLASNGDGPPLTISSPFDGEHTNNTTLVIQGSTASNAMVSITASTAGPSGAQSFGLVPEADGSFEKEFDVIEGRWDINVTVSDGSGYNTSAAFFVVVDHTPPDLQINSPTASPTYTKYPRITIVGMYDMDPNNFANEDRGTFSREVELVEGDNHIDIRFVDEAGNEAVEWVYVIADWTPPVVSIEEPLQDPYHTNNSTVRFFGRAGAGAVDVFLEHKGVSVPVTILEGDLNTSATWEYILELGPDDLDQDIIVKAVDYVGNEALATIRVIYDTVPPSLFFDANPTYVDQPRIQISGTTDIEIEFILVGSALFPVVDGEFTLIYSLIVKGRNLIEVVVYDEAGNAAREEIVVYYGQDPPKLKMDAPDRTDSTTVKIKGTTDMDVETVSINGAKHPVVDGKFSVEVDLTEGDNKFLVEVLDSEGNKASRTVVVEHSTPGFGAALAVALLAVVSALMTKRRSWR